MASTPAPPSVPPTPPGASAPPSAISAAGAGDTQWTRLHPLSPIVRAGSVVAVLVVFSTQFDTGRRRSFPWVSLVLLGVGIVAGVVSWLVTRWRVQGSDLRIETGLIRRQSIRVPLSRIQAVDVISPVLARVLGLAEVRVVVAGRGTGRTRLAYLGAAEAQRVRAMLLALAHGLASETPEPPAQPLLRIDNLRVAFATLLTAPVNVLITIAVLAVVLSLLLPRGEATATIAIPALVGVVPEVFRRFNAVYDFQLSEGADGFRLSRGLLQTRTETIPFGRIQAVRWVEPLLWRQFGWVRLEVDVARQRGSQQREEGSAQLSRTLLPVGSHDHAAWLLQRVLPGAAAVPPPGSRPPRRALLRAPFSYHLLSFWHDRGRHGFARTGRVRPEVVIVPLEKMQSVRLRQGPLQRWLHLATVHVDTAGRGWQARAVCRDAAEADALVETLTELARRARRASTAAAQAARDGGSNGGRRPLGHDAMDPDGV
ncbi:MAG: PH domain-containing protein [Candidatus Dormibacteraeota bacterium]|uniref:PH domain-containing protein n=1 Tax=Candidatus Amunia macphersoniae TaxID=3127014 RepID=A0A934N8K7_9BACT|nr:PH domain-containing protein [Candidatus Dormibacteraeota bacterium]